MGPETTNARILVVDDNARNRKLVEGILLMAGYTVIMAESGQQALDLFDEGRIDVILLDIMMPGMDGYETCRRLRALPGGDRTPIVFLTALSEVSAHTKAQEVGADDFLTKPIHGLELLLRIRSLLRISRLQQELDEKNEALRQAAEARADRNEHRYQTLFDSSNDAIIICDQAGRVREVNRRTEEYLGLDHAALASATVASLLSSPDQADPFNALLGTIQEEGRGVFEVSLQRADGSTFPAEVSATLFELDGVPTVQGLFRDITERKKAERELELTRAKEKAATDQLRIVSALQESFIAGTPAEQLYETMVERLLALTGSEYGFIGEVRSDDGGPPYLKVFAISHPEATPQVLRFQAEFAPPNLEFRGLDTLIGAVLTTGAPVIANSPKTDPRAKGLPPGHPRMDGFMGLPILKGGVMVGMVGVANRPGGYEDELVNHLTPYLTTCANIMEAIRAEQRRLGTEQSLRDAEAQLRQSQKMEAIGAVAGGVAHDFNNLLTVMIAFTRMVIDELPQAHIGRSDLSEVLRAADSAKSLTNQLLSFARRRPVEPRGLDANETFKQALKMLRRTLGEGIELVVHIGDERLPVFVDPTALDQVVFNLCVNARDAMVATNGGTLTATVGQRTLDESDPLGAGEYVELTVRDTGTGMPADVASRIFEPFFSTKGERGTGLGLATCYGIVKQAGGDIRVDTALGHGTTFTVFLPRMDVGTEAQSSAAAPIDGATFRGTALVVEDQPSILRVMTRTLTAVGFTVLEAHTAEEAISIVTGNGRRSIDLLVTDVVLPGMSGVGLMKQLRVVMPELPVVLTSGYMADDADAEGRHDPMVVFLPKPFSGSQLVSYVARVVTPEQPLAPV